MSVYQLVLIAFCVCTTQGTCPHQQSGFVKWSSDHRLPSGTKPQPNHNVIINKKVILDTSPPEFGGLTIGPHGHLVWSPAGDYSLKVKYIRVQGIMEIGSETCKFTAKAEITLTGIRGSYTIPGFGEKFIGVERGGTLEIHGANKLSWTKLSRTVPKVQQSQYYHEHRGSNNTNNDWMEGIGMYVINPSHRHIDSYKNYELSGDPSQVHWNERGVKEFPTDIKGVPNGRLILVAVTYTLKRDEKSHHLDAVYDAYEEALFGHVTHQSKLRTLKHRDAYVAYAIKGNHTSVVEEVIRVDTSTGRHKAELVYTDWSHHVKYTISSQVDLHYRWQSYPNFKWINTKYAYPIISVIEDVSSLKPGDTVFFASTDYNLNQAERATLVPCHRCNSHQFQVDHEFQHSHFGKIVDRVDMRGEVGLLTRNIKIKGEMQDHCPPSNGNCGTCPSGQENCGKYKYDTFGGHLKVLRGFKNVHIEGVELEHMGQQTQVGTYPLHFHMCEDVDGTDYPHPPYLKGNSIHDSFARCTTVHGTSGASVIDNVCHECLGHGYFLEDGGEKRTLFDGNLGAGIRRSRLIPSDDTPAVFWITNPLTRTINNVAAGSENTGIWFIFPREPTGPSTGMGFMKWANQTAILETDNNVAHSSFITAFNMESILEDNGKVCCNNGYNPKETPGDPKSESKEVVINRLTSYKNHLRNVWIRGGKIHMKHASLSDSYTGITMAKSSPGEQFMSNSIILGESTNKGEGDGVWRDDLQKTLYYQRSLALPWDPHAHIQGYVFYDGPVYIENVWFNRFHNTENYTMGAIGFERENYFANSPVSQAKNVQFGFDDGLQTGNWIYDGDSSDHGFTDYDGDKGATFLWKDHNSVSQIVKPRDFYVTNACEYRSNWKMAKCPHRYGKIDPIISQMGPGETKPHFMMRRDDIPSAKETIAGTRSSQFMVILGGTHSYTLHFLGKIPKKFSIYSDGFEKGYPVRFGICMPKHATFDLYSYAPHWRPTLDKWPRVHDLTALDNSDGGSYLYDENRGLLFVKFVSNNPRGEGITTSCNGTCPMLQVTIKSGDRSHGDCTAAAYPTYTRHPATFSVSIS
ncbi:hypothetical protein FSP39_022248 [Pinctada imbricata]|uniref:G8 domain-containing protein n=1 Tax=Pinctada imbricata TaxID=66713 RepID=A0AA88XWN8_PINIB|nr:hypothetical protein FSP39_022248 [Pinctada imbricata]